MENSFRIHTEITKDAVLNVNMKQDFDFLEVLSLKLRQADAYKLHSSNYGVIVGRVLANDAFGIPNARVSVFVPNEGGETSEIEKLYPYSSIRSTDSDGRRYNLLPDYSDNDCYRVVGTMPNKRLVLDNNTVLEVFDKYWKYSTVTNNSGDYMIFGIPSGNQEIKVDLDLSDIGVLSQKPTDFTYKGYNLSMFDSPTQFKESTNLDSLPQLFSQNNSVFVYPFWGDVENGIAAITRSDIQIQYKFEPTCVFMGSIVSDNEGNSLGHKCSPSVKNGFNNQLVAGEGNIEMIRKTPDGLVEEYQVQTGESLIDNNGVWCYQIPMNLDYVGMDEYGNIIPTDDPTKGVPTRARVRFRISKHETGNEGFSRHTAKYLVPMNPIFDEGVVIPTIAESGIEVEKMYNFGSATPESCFRDLYWNNVYSVKNYIPKIQVAGSVGTKNYTALKASNLVDNQNPVPFNKMKIDLSIIYVVLCIVYELLIDVIYAINWTICNIINKIIDIVNKLTKGARTLWGVIKSIFNRKSVKKNTPKIGYVGCIPIHGGFSEDENIAYYPGCSCKEGRDAGNLPSDVDANARKVDKKSDLVDKIQQYLAQEFNIVKLDLYQDWINGCLYMPLWYWRKRKKKTFFGLFTISRAKNQFCDCDRRIDKIKSYVSCSFKYTTNSLGLKSEDLPDGKDNDGTKWHKKKTSKINFSYGLIKQVENNDGLNVYYYSPIQPLKEVKGFGGRGDSVLAERSAGFKAIRLFATDIILLGNLNVDNLYGIPQLFKALPATTANIPPIATIYDESDNTNTKEGEKDVIGLEDVGVTVTTGMDWGKDDDAKKDSPAYSKGLFIDLSCTSVKTRPKSCINVERLSEYGVNLDMNYKMQYSNGSSLVEGDILPDGFISKYELDDMENRAMFATLNHVGFIPDSYQNENDFYQTQVVDEETSYIVPKFKYIYPVDFDGRLSVLMTRYRNGFNQNLSDVTDEAYLTFRLGAEADGNSGRKRHFYIQDGEKLEMPLYNNSFYFYFGINKGNTAIDKFNKLFYSECFQNKKHSFTMDISTRGVSYCPSVYDSKADAYGFIEVVSDDIQVPYSYSLYDNNDTLIISEAGMTMNKFVIGGKYDAQENAISCDDGMIHKQLRPNGTPGTDPCSNESIGVGLTNQPYRVELVDGNGKMLYKEVNLEKPKISLYYDVVDLSTKFYNTSTTNINYICNEETKFYGKIYIRGLIIDGYDVTINEASVVRDGSDYKITLVCSANGISSTTVVINMRALNGETTSCSCENNTSGLMYYVFDGNTGTLEFRVYQPTDFMLDIVQMCDGEESENKTSVLITVENGVNFNTFLNEMPVRFMLGTLEDDTAMTISNRSNFYRRTAVTTPIGDGITGWFGVHDEDTYKFSLPQNQTKIENDAVWRDFLYLNNEINKYNSKLAILKYKLDTMFSLSNSVYVTNASNPDFYFTFDGGTSPILPRVLRPCYEDDDKLLINKSYIYTEGNTATLESHLPNIVGSNYLNASTTCFNPLYDEGGLTGNYFAAFTNNGGYTSNTSIDTSLYVAKQPNYAAVAVVPKNIGTDIEDHITPRFTRAYNFVTGPMTMPHLRAEFVDRRFDYDLIIFSPVIGQIFSLRSQTNKDITWKGGRISGITYNGIEMSYDSEYNIINASVSDNARGMTNTLEYTYALNGDDDEDVKTRLNSNPTIKKRPYSASINNFDIKDLFWSEANKEYISPSSDESAPNFVFNHRNDNAYNGYFNTSNYPTKRVIDIGNLSAVTDYTFEYTSCSYNTTAQVTEDGSLKLFTREGEDNSIHISFTTPYTMINQNADNNFQDNMSYALTRSVGEYSEFTLNRFTLKFNYNLRYENDYLIHAEKPRLVKVLPYYSSDIDGITRIKFTSGNTNVESVINGLTVGDITSTSDISEFSSEENEFANVVFTHNGTINGGTVFSLLSTMDYVNDIGDNLTKHIKLYHFGELFDGRRILLKADSSNSYLEYKKLGYVDGVVTDGEIQGGSVDDEGNVSGNIETDTGNVDGYVQTIAFNMNISQVGTSPETTPSQAFADYRMMSFVFVFTDSANRKYNINCSDVQLNGNVITFKVVWSQGMGYLCDENWNSVARVKLFAKTSSNFTYGIGEFSISGSQGLLPTEENTIVQTLVTIIN